jgi:hypothetical protein
MIPKKKWLTLLLAFGGNGSTFDMENGEPYTTTQMNEYGLWVISVD